MNFTTKALAAAIALIASAGANAALVAHNNAATGGSLVLAVWDDIAQVSYVRDLGLVYGDFEVADTNTAAGAFITFATDSLFGTTFAASTTSNIRWHVFSFENSNSIDGTRANLNVTQGAVPANATNTTTLANAGAQYSFIAVNGSSAGKTVSGNSYATDNTVFTTGAAVAGGGSSSANGGRLLGTLNLKGTSSGGIGESLNFFNYRGGSTPSGAGSRTAYAEQFTLSANGTLTYGEQPSAPVPVPAAVWLLGSALAGVAGVSRRRA